MKNAAKALLVASLLGAFVVRPLAAEDLRIDIVAKLTDAGRKVARPAPDRPAYYVPVSYGYQEMGDIETFWVRKAPTESEVRPLLLRELARQGYLTATKAHPPSLFIAYVWGYIGPGQFGGADRMLGMLMGKDDISMHRIPPPKVDEALSQVIQPQFYFAAFAFDYKAWTQTQHQHVLLWRADFTIPMWGHYLDQVLPNLIVDGAPSLGTDAGDRSGFVTVPAIPEGRVIVGTPTLKSQDTPASATHGQ